MKLARFVAYLLVLLCLWWLPANAQWNYTKLPFFYGYATALSTKDTNLFLGTSLSVPPRWSSSGRGGQIFLYHSADSSWTEVKTSWPNAGVQAFAMIGTNLFAGTLMGVFRSTDDGASWTAANTGIYTTICALAVSGTTLFAGAYGDVGVYRSTDYGAHWTAVGAGLPYPCLVLAFAVVGTDLFVGIDGGGGVFKSTDSGTSWTAVNAGLTNLNVVSLAASGTNLFAGIFDGGVFLSTDRGTSWTEVNAGLTSKYITSLVVAGPDLFAGTDDSGIFRLAIGGSSWTGEVNYGVPGPSISALAVVGTDLFVGGSRWVCMRPLSQIVTSSGEPAADYLPEKIVLQQNYPNPFNPATQINYTIGEREKEGEGRRNVQVQLIVYDLLGRQVATLVNEPQRPGNYSVKFDGSHLASGVYLYRLQAGGFRQVKKMVIVK